MTTKPPSCTDPALGALLASYELGLLADDERRRVDDHVLECATCFAELEATAPVVEHLARRRTDGDVEAARWAQDADSELEPSATVLRAHARRPSRRAVLIGAVAATVLLGAVVVVLVRSPARPDGGFRGASAVEILLLAPVGEVPRPEALDWAVVAEATGYAVELQDADGAPIWSAETERPPLALPATVRQLLERGRVYAWRVTAHAPDGRSRESPFETFTITR